MRKPIITLLVAISTMCTACSDDDMSPYSYDTQSSILYGSNQTSFKEILFFIKPYLMEDGQKIYVATDTLFNILVKVNTLTWSKKSSLPVDTSAYNIITKGNFHTANTPVSFPVVATYQTNETIKEQAGHYADLLLNYQTLTAGDYLLRVESFEMKLKDGSVKKVATPISVPLTVKDNTRSTYIGEFEVQVRP